MVWRWVRKRLAVCSLAARSLVPAMALALVVALAAGCAGVSTSGEGDTISAAGGSITVFAASSLAPVMEELAQRFEQDRTGQGSQDSTERNVQDSTEQDSQGSTITVLVSLAGSATLREQLLAGAPADVFIPAASSHLTAVANERRLAAPAVLVAKNSLALAVPTGNPAQITGLADLARPELLVGLCAGTVPCGALAQIALAQAGITPSPDTEAANVSALATQLAAGELDVAIVYKTNTLADGIALVEAVPGDASYPAGVLADTDNELVAQAFVEFLVSPGAQEIFTQHGFVLP